MGEKTTIGQLRRWPKKKAHPKFQIIGRLETILLPQLCPESVEAKIDTGAYRTAIHSLSCREIDEGDKRILEVVFHIGWPRSAHLVFR